MKDASTLRLVLRALRLTAFKLNTSYTGVKLGSDRAKSKVLKPQKCYPLSIRVYRIDTQLFRVESAVPVYV